MILLLKKLFSPEDSLYLIVKEFVIGKLINMCVRKDIILHY